MLKRMKKKEMLSLLKDKLDDRNDYSYSQLERITGYSSRHLKRLAKELEERDVETVIIHGNTGKKPAITASDQEISYIVNFKVQYPKITIAQFKDIYDEDIIDNPRKKSDVRKYGLRKRSLSFFRDLYVSEGWKSPVKRRRYSSDYPVHHLREALPRKGMLVQIDGTPYDWLNTGRNYCLHLAIDDASKEIIAGWFTPNECLYGYLKITEIMIRDYGIPVAVYSDKHAIFRSIDEFEGKTRFQKVMERLGIETILANSSQAKGRVERYNGTIQLRLINDIIRKKIKNYDQLNEWFNSYYKHYLNRKFSVLPKDPNDEFVPVDDDFDYTEKLSLQEERTIQNGDVFSYEGCLFSPYDDQTGEIIHIRKGVKVNVYHDILHRKIYIRRYGKAIPCRYIRDIRSKDEVDNRKDLSSRVKDYIDRRKK